jgi:hypothetical protein
MLLKMNKIKPFLQQPATSNFKKLINDEMKSLLLYILLVSPPEMPKHDLFCFFSTFCAATISKNYIKLNPTPSDL